MGKAWPALRIHVPGCDPQLQELVIAELDDFQPTAIQEVDDTSPFRAFFTSVDLRDAAARAIGTAFGTYVYVESIDVPDEDWAARSQAQLKAITIGRIVVAPPWDDEVRKRGREGFSPVVTENPSRPLFVVIHPSMGFGTGHHPTTRLALRALQQLPLDNCGVLDIGCGSGVLAIAAVRLGAQSAVGIDIDPDALENATENVALNSVTEQVRFEEADFREMSARADVVTANLTAVLLERSAEQLSEFVGPGGYLVVTGFTKNDENVTATLEQFLTLQKVEAEEEWLCATYCRGNGGAAFGPARL